MSDKDQHELVGDKNTTHPLEIKGMSSLFFSLISILEIFKNKSEGREQTKTRQRNRACVCSNETFSCKCSSGNLDPFLFYCYAKAKFLSRKMQENIEKLSVCDKTTKTYFQGFFSEIKFYQSIKNPSLIKPLATGPLAASTFSSSGSCFLALPKPPEILNDM